MATDVAKWPANAVPTKIREYLEQHRDEIVRALPKQVSADRIIRVSINSLQRTKALADCTFSSFVGAVLQSAMLGLEPNTPLQEAAIIPYGTVATFQPMYRGLIKIARNTGELKIIYAHVVHQRDEFDIDLGLDRRMIHKPSLEEDPGEAVGAYAVFQLASGEKDFEWMSAAQILQVKSVSKNTGKDSPWNRKGPDEEMWKKTPLKRLLKRAPQSTEMAQALELDNRINGISTSDEALSEANIFESIPDGEALQQLANPETDDAVILEEPQRKSAKKANGNTAPIEMAESEPVI